MGQVNGKIELMRLQYDEETVIAHVCNGVARDRTLTGYVQARNSINPCIMELIGQVGTDNMLLAIADQPTCEQGISNSIEGRMMVERDPGRNLRWQSYLLGAVIACEHAVSSSYRLSSGHVPRVDEVDNIVEQNELTTKPKKLTPKPHPTFSSINHTKSLIIDSPPRSWWIAM